MTIDDARNRLHALKMTAGMNQRYHQCLEWWWDFGNKLLQITVAAFSVLGFGFALGGEQYIEAGIWLAAFGALTAVALNVVPTGDIAKFYSGMFRSWTELRREAEIATIRVDREQSALPPLLVEWIEELIEKSYYLDAEEPAVWKWHWNRCEKAEYRSTYGQKITSAEEANEFLAKQRPVIFSAAAGEQAAESVRQAARG